MSTYIGSAVKTIYRFPILLSLLVFALLGPNDTAFGQANLLQVSQVQPIINAPLGGSTQTQLVNVTSSSGVLSYNIGVSSSLNWLSVDKNGGTTPGSFTISASPGNLGIGSYGGTITLSAPGANNVVLTLTLNVGTATALTISSNSLTFSSQVGSATPTTPQALTIGSASNAVQFISSVTYGQSNVPAWLQGVPANGATNANLQLSALATGLAAGTYTATVTFSSAQSSPVQVFVTFTVTALPVLTVSQTSISLFYQVNQGLPTQASLSVTSGTGTIPINIASTTTSCGSWLVVNPQGAVGTPANITVGANSFGLTQATTCNGSITITATGVANSPITIPVTLTVSTTPLLLITPTNPAPFTYQAGGAVPSSQNLAITSSSTPLPFTATSDQPWLTVTPSGTTAAPGSTLTLAISPTALTTMNPGTYKSTVTVTAPAASNSPVLIPVTLTISASSLFTVTPPFVNLNYQIGQQAPTPAGITIGSTGAAIPYFISVPTTTTAQFVTINGAPSASGTTPATIAIGASPLPTVAGTYTNTLVINNPSDPTVAPQTVQVQLTVSNTALLNASPQALTFTVPIGQTNVLPSQAIAFSSTDPNGPITFKVSANVPWLTPILANGTQTGTTPSNLSVSIAPYVYTAPSLPGTYSGTIIVTSTNQAGQALTPLNIPVTLVVTSGISLTAAPVNLNFTQANSAAAPANQTITVGTAGHNSGTLPFSASVSTLSGGAWLAVTPATGTAPGVVTVSITALAATLAPGTYNGSVVLTSVTAANPNGVLTIPVVLTVTAASSISASPLGVTLTGNVGGANPASAVAITAPGQATPVAYSAAVAPGATWLSVSPAAGSTPGTLTVTANLSGLTAGTYNGSVVVTPVGSTPLTIPVTLTVAAQTIPAVTQIQNAASGAAGAIAPGEIVSIFGSGIGPAIPAGLALTPSGAVSTSLAGVTVTFNGVAAPLTYVSATQINCVVPYEVAGSTTVPVAVSYNGLTAPATASNVVGTLPGIFTQNGSGTGIASILKPDYSLVTTINAAPRGSTVLIYATGEGQTNPAGVTGSVASTLKSPAAAVSVTIGGQDATVSYAGSAPGLVSGVLQLNVIVPATIGAGTQPLVVTIGGKTSQTNVTIPVQ